MTIQNPTGKNSDHPEASKKSQQPDRNLQEILARIEKPPGHNNYYTKSSKNY